MHVIFSAGMNEVREFDSQELHQVRNKRNDFYKKV